MEEQGKIVNVVVFFVLGLIMTLIIGFTVITTLVPVQEDLATTTSTITVTNESGHINETTYTLATTGYSGFTSPAIVTIINDTTFETISAPNYTLSSAGVLVNASSVEWNAVLITYTYGLKGTTASVDQLRNNMTTGINNISNKIPTMLLVAAVVIILAILLILWGYYKGMNLGGSSSSVSGEL